MSQETVSKALPDDSLSAKYRKTSPKDYAAGNLAVAVSMKHIQQQSGMVRGTKALLKLNQKNGFDCPSCAWPDPDDHRATTEFCENGAKAVASETTKRTITADFFKKYSLTELGEKTDYWHEQQGRLTEPMYKPAGSDYYEPISWEDAFATCARHLKALHHPDEACFYTSGRASNEAAFTYQLLARQFGTNNLPDCSNMCHESSGAALNESVGVGKGTVTLEDFLHAETILIIGQNPGTNHPRMLATLQEAKKRGATIISINPLAEAGLMGFAHPQQVRGMLNMSTKLTDHFLPVKVNGDLPLLQGFAKAILEDDSLASLIKTDFIAAHTEGYEAYRTQILSLSWDEIVAQSGIEKTQILEIANILAHSKASIFCWAMGLTQHKNAVSTIQEVVNLALLGGHLGRIGAGLCPVRGHSNVQGDRTMGVWEKMPESFLSSLDKEFAITSPRKIGYDTIEAIEAMHEGKAKVFIGLGGNFLSATPDTCFTAEALSNCDLTVQISTKLNRSHVVTGKEALILPCLGRSEVDSSPAGEQFITCENSMGVVQKSVGRLSPISETVKSETAIVCGIAHALLGSTEKINWSALGEDYSLIRNHIERVVPGFERFNERIETPGGFYLPNSAKKLNFQHIGGKAKFTQSMHEPIALAENQLLLMTLRSHDQFNTTIYGMDDRYRGIYGERRVIFLNKEDMQAQSITEEQPLDITSHFEGKTRTAHNFLAVTYPIPRGCAAAYFPEANVLIPINSKADKSNTPTSKSIIITLQPRK